MGASVAQFGAVCRFILLCRVCRLSVTDRYARSAFKLCTQWSPIKLLILFRGISQSTRRTVQWLSLVLDAVILRGEWNWLNGKMKRKEKSCFQLRNRKFNFVIENTCGKNERHIIFVASCNKIELFKLHNRQRLMWERDGHLTIDRISERMMSTVGCKIFFFFWKFIIR